MSKGKIADAVKSGKTLVSDGAWGTFLQKKGMKPGECPEQWCIDHFDEVVSIAKSYVDAGSDMVESNSFGGTSFKLKPFGLDSKVKELNVAAAKASRAAAGDDKWVIASVGPTGKFLVTEEVTEEELYNCFKDQIMALEEGGADAVCIETMSDTEEAAIACKAAKENTGLEVICTYTFERTSNGDYRTMMGATPESATEAALAAGADIVGANCGNGIERMIEIVTRIRKVAPETPILVHANAGLPQLKDGKDFFPETPQDMANAVGDLVKAGANIIGGCCGTTPEHIKAMKEAL